MVTERAVVTPMSAHTAARLVRLAMAGTVAGAVLGVGYFTAGGVFAQLSDATGVVTGVAMAPVVTYLWRRTRRDRARAADANLAVGLAGSAALVVSSIALILGDSGLPVVPGRGALVGQFLGFGLLGGWLLLGARPARRIGLMSRRTAGAAAVAGLGYVIVGAGEPLTGFGRSITYSVGGVAFVAFVLWALWAARDLEGWQT